VLVNTLPFYRSLPCLFTEAFPAFLAEAFPAGYSPTCAFDSVSGLPGAVQTWLLLLLLPF